MDVLQPSFGAARRLILLTLCRVRLLREEGKRDEAVDLLLDGCQFARDFGSNTPPSVENSTYPLLDLLLRELREHLRLDVKERLAEIARGMETLDRTLPEGQLTIRNGVLSWGFTFLHDGERIGGWLNVAPPGWKDLFSWRLRLAGAFDELEDFLRDVPAGPVSAEKGNAMQTRWRSRMDATRNPVTRGLLEDVMSAPPSRLKARVHLRLLRIAAHWRATGERLDLEERPGVRFQVEERDGVLEIRSAARKELSLEVRR